MEEIKKPNYELYEALVAEFGKRMIEELAANHTKGDRDLPNGWLNMTSKELLNEIYYHVGKLQEACRHQDVERIKEFSADVANMCLMMHDCWSLLIPYPFKTDNTQ
jgi:hypothetical protein